MFDDCVVESELSGVGAFLTAILCYVFCTQEQTDSGDGEKNDASNTVSPAEE
jgi:hypothetical protein